MRTDIRFFLKGSVDIEIRGGELEAVLNDAAAAGLELKDVRRTSPDKATAAVDVPAFFPLAAILRRRRCRLRILRRRGLPFVLRRAGGRMFFAAGFAGFVFGLWLLGQVIWTVDVAGAKRIPESRVRAAAAEMGIRPLAWKFGLDAPGELSRRLTALLPGAAWIGVDVQGTRVLIRVVEQTLPEKRERLSPRHLVAGYDAVVTRVLAERGRPAVRPGDRVRKGDVLVSGLVGDGERVAAVPAEGTVMGLVWHEYDIVSPLEHRHKVYTGKRHVKRWLVFGGRALQIAGFGDPGFARYETSVERKVLAWRNRTLPFGTIREELRETEVAGVRVAAEEARAIGLTQARGDVLRKAGEGAVIRAENLLHEKIDGGKVYMKVLFEVEQDISTERLIVQGE